MTHTQRRGAERREADAASLTVCVAAIRLQTKAFIAAAARARGGQAVSPIVVAAVRVSVMVKVR